MDKHISSCCYGVGSFRGRRHIVRSSQQTRMSYRPHMATSVTTNFTLTAHLCIFFSSSDMHYKAKLAPAGHRSHGTSTYPPFLDTSSTTRHQSTNTGSGSLGSPAIFTQDQRTIYIEKEDPKTRLYIDPPTQCLSAQRRTYKYVHSGDRWR